MMNRPCGTGTIIAATSRKDFAIIAADRMWHAVGSNITGCHRKIILHPLLPIAIGLMGYTRVKTPWHPTNRGNIRINAFMKAIFKEIRIVDNGTIEFIKSRSEEIILPGVRLERNKAKTEQDAQQIAILLFVVMHFDGNSRFYCLGLMDEMRLESHESTIANPPCLDDLYRKDDRDTYGYHLGAGFESSARIADRLKRTIERGIAAEADLNGGVNQLVGGGIDIAIVDQRGARFLFKDSRAICF